jgi:predicted nuclease of restriction endonuclease-like (RecB) superfamily
MAKKLLTKQYKNWLIDLKKTIDSSKLRTAMQVNSNMLLLYWFIGNEINAKIDKEGWGNSIVEKLSGDLQAEFPELKGFSVRSLEYMQQFAKAYPTLLIPQQAVAEMGKSKKSLIPQQPVAELGNTKYILENPLLISIPWGHLILLLQKLNNITERNWYLEQTLQHNWSRAVLQYQLDTDLYQRQVRVKKTANFHQVLPQPQSDLALQILKDPYKFEFLQIGTKITELELERTLIRHLQDFLTELGAGFAFMGRQVKIKIGRKEKILDLFFYHIHLRSFIVIELKMGEFDALHVGQMNAYLNVVNKVYRRTEDNPSIGIILCAEKDNVEVEFALMNVQHPIGVSEYKMLKTLPKAIKDKMPTAKQLQDEIKKFLRKNKQKTKM